MAEAVDEAEFWLPTEFSNKNMFMHKKHVNTEFGPSLSRHSFPTEFPHEFDSFGSSSSALSSPVESVVGSTETESSDEEDFFAGLTRRLTQYSLNETQQLAVPSLTQDNKTEKKWVLSGSPQSTLGGIGSWSFSSDGSSPNGVSSPPTTPFGAKNDTWDLIYAAAGQVARLKMSTQGPKYNINNHNNHQPKGLLGPARTPNPVPLVKNPNSGLYTHHGLAHNLAQTNQYQYMRQDQVMKQQCAPVWGRQGQQQQIQSRGRSVGYENGRCGRPLGLPQSAWPPLQVQAQPQPQQQPQQSGSGMRAVFLSGSGVKRECAGTGVFLPRRYGNPPDSRKKSGCSTVLLPVKVVQALNLNLDDLRGLGHGHDHGYGHGDGHAQPLFNTGFAPDYDALLARRNAQLTQQKRSLRPEGARSHELRLPQEWTY